MALSEIEKLERRYAENPQGLTFAPLAEVHRKNGDVARALELLRPGLTLHPDYIPASIVLGRCHLDSGELPAAETAFTHVLALDGENVIALKALADITERQGRFDEAERLLRTLLAIDRSNDEARDQLGRVEAARRQTATSAVVDVPGAPPVEAAAAAGSLEAAAPAEPASAGGEPASTTAEVPAAATPPMAEPPAEHVMGWVTESTGADATEAVPLDLEELGTSLVESTTLDGIQLEQPATLADTVEPIAGLVGRGDDVDLGSFDHVSDFSVETAEDIVLNSSGGGEFQVANAAEELRTTGDAHEPSLQDLSAEAEPAADIGRDTAGGDEAYPAVLDDGPAPIAFEPHQPAGPGTAPPEPVEVAAHEPAWSAPVDIEPARIEPAESTLADAASVTPQEEADARAAAGPVAAEAKAPENVAEPTVAEAPVAEAAAPEPPAPAAPEPWLASASEPPRSAEPDLVVTGSMAELLLQQGHPVEALTVYRLLETRAGGQSRYREKIEELERLTAPAPEPASSASEPNAAPTAAYSVLQTRGQSAQAFLRAILTARPRAMAPGAAVHPSPARADAASSEGAPTRPAHDSLSLSSVFGEESAPTQPAVPAAGGGTAPAGVSYDEFFGAGSGPAAPRQQRAPDPKSDDLDQFHAWLQNLKR